MNLLETETYNLVLETGNASLILPHQITFDDQYRLKRLIELMPHPPTPMPEPKAES